MRYHLSIVNIIGFGHHPLNPEGEQNLINCHDTGIDIVWQEGEQ